MSVISMKQLLEAGVHFGHQTRRWNPKMAEYIFMERNGIYIIDLQKTVKKLEEAYFFVRDLAAEGGSVLFVGTKKQAQDAVKEEAEKVGMFYVNARWLGGMLTNFTTIKKRIQRMDQLKKMAEDGTFDQLPKKEVVNLTIEAEKLENTPKMQKSTPTPIKQSGTNTSSDAKKPILPSITVKMPAISVPNDLFWYFTILPIPSSVGLCLK